ncbi:MAG TPA: 50S ribosomal protein L24 [Clostridiales bacterium]|nr:MAG: 50S ribosomal protein L24 [Clostridiales bacterium GWD2_32_59]HAN09229.1 50S ribosomal protein L24 [Clostridiales bacterium]
MALAKLKKGDKVVVIAGKDKGTKSEILGIDAKNSKVIVKGVNMIKKHQKANAQTKQGGIFSREGAIELSNVMYLHNGQPTRIGVKVSEDKKTGKVEKNRVAKKTGEIID